MKIDDILLMAYVDGELTSHQREEVERAIGTSPDIATRVAWLEASVLPYQRAFEQQEWPSVPQSLVHKVAEIAQAYVASSDVVARDVSRSVDAPVPQPEVREAFAAPIRSRFGMMAPWLAVAFVAGAFCFGAILRFAPGAARGGFAPQAAPMATQTRASPWIMAAANYQRLYTRDTVAFDSSNPAVAAHTVENIRRDDGLPIRIPDLRSAGLTFKRIQRLRFNDKPLVQIVYLPEKGMPVALCLMKDDKPDTALARQQVGGMDVVTWRRANLTYALIAPPGDTDLGAIGKQISENVVGERLGQVPHVDLAIAS
ncbi:anti-sigma factor [Burkholderia sp. HI2761]|uniref:anti-sigma factor n=1 Tax=Burkholderia TaxID=32008 RepID=UPI000414B7BA|nr:MULTISPECIES: anti-sigma factor [Burkholderia]MPV57392.1 anti-sigma factor [Burkholderia sp. BE24]OXJ22329.1 anti-sigma factor [Burkholderia sp. HI2761]